MTSSETQSAAMYSLPGYTRGEELFNMASHIFGGVIGVAGLIACMAAAVKHGSIWGIVTGIVYGASVILLYTMSSVYHGLNVSPTKKLFRVFDHCTIFVMIAGCATPILLGAFRQHFPVDAWLLFAFMWGAAVFGVILNVIDLNKYRKLSIVCYLAMGWCGAIRISRLLETYPKALFIYLLAGGISYTVGALLYAFANKKKYIHSVFHLFVVAATALHFIGIILYVL